MIDGDASGGERRTAAPQPSNGQWPNGQWQAVRSDMRTIFGAEGTGPPRVPPVAAPAFRATPSRSRARRWAVPFALLTCVAGAAAGLVVVSPLKQAPAPKAPSAFPRAGTPDRATGTPTAMTVATASPFATPTTVPSWHRGNAPDMAMPARSVDSAQTVRDDVGSARMPAAGDPDARRGCDDEDDARYAACSRSEVILADRDLRQAYLRAVDVGVDRGQLVSIRNLWARLRATEYDRPDALLAGYAELTDRLDRATDDAGVDLR